MIEENFAYVRRRIAEAAEAAGRDPSSILLVAITKGVSAPQIRQAYALGQRDFGENRADEALSKFEQLADLSEIRWHFVGRLQRNKVKTLVRSQPVIHSVDRIELAEEIAKWFDRPVQIMIEVNVGGESQKGGVAPSGLENLIRGALGLPHIEVAGLMTMAPQVAEPEQARPYFRKLAEIRGEMKEKFPAAMIHHLSMGMSQDYGVAIEEGATMVRIGRAIFGHERSAMTLTRGLRGSPGSQEER